MYNKILVAVDKSEYSDLAVDMARDLAHVSGAKVLVLHVSKMILGMSGDLLDAEDESEVGKLLEKDAHRFEELGVPVSIQIRTAEIGRTAHQIVQAAGEFGADVIVMGSRGHSELSSFVLGSVAHGVMRHATCRVVVVH